MQGANTAAQRGIRVVEKNTTRFSFLIQRGATGIRTQYNARLQYLQKFSSVLPHKFQDDECQFCVCALYDIIPLVFQYEQA
jgi:hypothetical protein